MASPRPHTRFLPASTKYSDLRQIRKRLDLPNTFKVCSTTPLPQPFMVPHAHERAKQRYGLDFTQEDVDALVTLCETHWNNTRHCEMSGPLRYRLTGVYRDKTVRLVFYPPTRVIITFLPWPVIR